TDADRQQEERQRQHDVDEPRDEGVQLAAAEPGDQPQGDPDNERDPRGHDRDHQGGPRTVKRPDEDVATEAVDPEPRALARTQERHADIAGVVLVEVVRPAMDEELRECRAQEREGDQEQDDKSRADGEAVPPEAGPEELPRGSALDLLGSALSGCEDLDSRLGLLDLAHTPLPPFTTAEV